MNTASKRWFTLLALATSATLLVAGAQADPLPGRDLPKFTQLPMLNTALPGPNGTVQFYHGHDELSTAYGFVNAANPVISSYDGRFMADDFADNLSTPVLHVKWWGSYLGDVRDPNTPVNKFLIAFESDQPANTANPFSHPLQPLSTQVLTFGALAPGSGTYTEKLVQPATPGSDAIYEYNGELANPFPEKQDTVYWLKIAALVDVNPAVPQFNPSSPPTGVTQWGWHNRDYTVQNTLAAPASVNVSKGEYLDGPPIGNFPIYHFEDDAVAGDMTVVPIPPLGTPQVPAIRQQNYAAQFYKDFADGPGPGPVPPGTVGISHFSKDLAFELYTTNNVPEPSSCLLLVTGLAGLFMRKRSAR